LLWIPGLSDGIDHVRAPLGGEEVGIQNREA